MSIQQRVWFGTVAALSLVFTLGSCRGKAVTPEVAGGIRVVLTGLAPTAASGGAVTITPVSPPGAPVSAAIPASGTADAVLPAGDYGVDYTPPVGHQVVGTTLPVSVTVSIGSMTVVAITVQPTPPPVSGTDDAVVIDGDVAPDPARPAQPDTYVLVGGRAELGSAPQCVSFRGDPATVTAPVTVTLTGLNMIPSGAPCSPSTVAAFSANNAAGLVAAPGWTSTAGEVQRVTLTPRLQVKLKVWIATASIAPADVTADVGTANVVYDTTRVGFVFVAETADKSGDVTAVTAIGGFCATVASLTAAAVYDPSLLNVYYVPEVVEPTTGDQLRGQWCGPSPPVIYVSASKQSSTTLAHELGHALALQHATWDTKNLMWAGAGLTDDQADARRHFTVGQAFWMNVDKTSWIYTAGIRSGTDRDCTVPLACPLPKFSPP